MQADTCGAGSRTLTSVLCPGIGWGPGTLGSTGEQDGVWAVCRESAWAPGVQAGGGPCPGQLLWQEQGVAESAAPSHFGQASPAGAPISLASDLGTPAWCWWLDPRPREPHVPQDPATGLCFLWAPRPTLASHISPVPRVSPTYVVQLSCCPRTATPAPLGVRVCTRDSPTPQLLWGASRGTWPTPSRPLLRPPNSKECPPSPSSCDSRAFSPKPSALREWVE